MSTTLHSFIDIFDTEFITDGIPVCLKKIVIPIIQRDYAQGRESDEVSRIRSRFLDSLYDAVTKKPITLDFVYGDIDADGVMTPLDGQQRLTTLFLLHWYAAKKEKAAENACGFLKNFSYETRYSARYFCTELVKFSPVFSSVPSKEIINQAWFPLDWKKDPTIHSMLVMLDAIDERFMDVPDLWDQLQNRAITFYFLPIRDMGLTDELYIKMNSRGKPLTQFEHFKAELERQIRILDEAAAKRISSKIDMQWTELLWMYRDSGNDSPEDNVIDDEFLRYFKFICDVICYRHGESPQKLNEDEQYDEFSLLRRYFSSDAEDLKENIKTLEEFFDCWCQIPGYTSPSDFLASFMTGSHEPGKVVVDIEHYKVDIFADCLRSYSDKTGRRRQFPLNRIVLLYAITIYLQNTDSVTESEFIHRFRMVNNLTQNSEDEVSDRADRNRMPAILRQVDAIILNGQSDDLIENSFNVNQLQEEKEKLAYLEEHPEAEVSLYRLEDHPMLKGQIGIVGLEHLDLVDRFESLFKCSWDRIDCAMMSYGNYGQKGRNGWRYQFASKGRVSAWNSLFHKSANDGFENTSEVLIQLLADNEAFSDELLADIAAAFTDKCETDRVYPWRYYYIKYPEFRPGRFGKLSNDNASENPYMYSVMWTETAWSSNMYMPYLKIADEAHLDRDSFGQRLVYGEHYIKCENTGYILYKLDGDSIEETIDIQQNDEGIDTEDRILRLKAYILSHFPA